MIEKIKVKKNNSFYIVEWVEKNKSNFLVFKNKKDIELSIKDKKRQKDVLLEVAKNHPEILI